MRPRASPAVATTLACALAAALAGTPARADESAGLPSTSASGSSALTGQARAGLQVFAEPARTQSVTVVTPSVSGRADLKRWLSVGVDWSADVVSGATPRTYGAPDVVTAATRFSELRNTVGARLEARTGPFTGSAGYHFGLEHDYRSHRLDLSGQLDLLQHDLQLAVRYAHDFDSVCDLDNHGLAVTQRQPLDHSAGCFAGTRGLTEEPLAIDGAELSASYSFTPRLVGALVGSYEHLDGFQSNPYRRVRLSDGAIFAQESHPRLRDRGALAARLKWAVPRTRAALGGDLRLYRDTWGVQSIAIDASWDALALSDRLRWRVHARYYQQSRAVFYRDAGEADSYERLGPAGQYFTGDHELSPFGDLVVGGALGWRAQAGAKRLGRLFRSLEASVRLDLTKVFSFSPEPPNAARTRGAVDAITAGLSLTGTL